MVFGIDAPSKSEIVGGLLGQTISDEELDKNPSLPPYNVTPLTTVIQIGGYVGVLTALVAWYTSAAGVINGLKGRQVFWVGKPLFALGR